MPRYPESKLDRAVGSAIDRENAAAIKEDKTGEYVDTPDRAWLREILNAPIEEKS